MDRYEAFRDRTSRELGLSGNHPDAIPKHLDAYEEAVVSRAADRLALAVAAGEIPAMIMAGHQMVHLDTVLALLRGETT